MEKGGSDDNALFFEILIVVGIIAAGIYYFTQGDGALQRAGLKRLSGTVQQGADIPGKDFCPQGLYLVNDTSTLLLREKNENGEDVMISNSELINKAITLEGVYPVSEVRCQALICGCEDFIRVDSIAP